jgi:predicted HD superfamily hydrolase involved in NAD metabolism
MPLSMLRWNTEPTEVTTSISSPLPPEFQGLQPAGDPIARVCEFLRPRRPETLRHVEAVSAKAVELAELVGADSERVRLAAISHDLAAVVPAPRIVPVAEEVGLELTPEDRLIPQVLHGPIASMVIQLGLGVVDPEVVAAVRYHTTLCRGASSMTKIVFLADKLAYDLTTLDVGYISAAERALTVGLDEAVHAYLDFVVTNNDRLGWRLHSDLTGAWEELGKGQA